MSWQNKLYDNLADADLPAFRQSLASLFAGISYQNYANKIIEKYEGYYASVVYTYLASLGIPIIAEDHTNRGRIDLRACQKLTRPSCISDAGHLWPHLNRTILDVALLRLRLCSIGATKYGPHLSAILAMLFFDRP